VPTTTKGQTYPTLEHEETTSWDDVTEHVFTLLDSGLGATVQEQAEWRGIGPWLVYTTVVSFETAPAYPECADVIETYVVESYDEALRLMAWWDARERSRQDRAEREILAAEHAQEMAEILDANSILGEQMRADDMEAQA
jgi:hypothetical protein